MSINTPHLPLQTRVLWVVAFLLSLPLGAQVQQAITFPTCDTALLCRDFQKIRAKTLDYLAKEDGAEAYKQLKALEACDKCPEHRDALDAISDEIIDLFRQQNDALNEVIGAQEATLLRLQKLNEDLAQEQRKVDRQLAINEQITKDALVTNFVRLAQRFFDNGTEIGKKEAAWIADFTYTYVDSTHHDLKKIMYSLVNEELRVSAPYDLQGEAQGYESLEDIPTNIEVTAVEWSPDGRWMALGTSLGQVIILDEAENVIFKSRLSSFSIGQLAWRRDGRTLAFAMTDQQIGFLQQGNDETWGQTDFFINNGNSIYALRFSPTTDLLAIGDNSNVISLYNVSDEAADVVQVFPTEHTDWVRDVAWSPDGEQLVSAGDDGFVITWSRQDNSALHRQKVHTDYVRTVDWHPTRPIIVSGSDDNRVIFWNATQLTPVSEQDLGEWIMKVRFTEWGDDVDVYTNSQQIVRLAAPRMQGEVEKGADGNVRQARQVYLSPQGNVKLGVFLPYQEWAESEDLDLQDRGSSATPVPESGTITVVRWSPDGERLAFAKDYSLLVSDDTRILSVNLEEVNILDIAWHPGLSSALPNTNYLVTTDGASRLIRWDVTTLEIDKVVDLDVVARTAAWSPDGNTLVLGNDQGEILFFDRDLTPLYRQAIHTDYIRKLAWSPNGQYIVTASDDRSNVVWDVSDGTLKAAVNMHQDWIRTVAWLDDTHFVSAGDDGKALLWAWSKETSNFRVAQKLETREGYYYASAFNPSSRGGTLALGTSNGQITLWNMDAQYKATPLDSMVMTSAIYDMDWHPSKGALSFTQFDTVPVSLNIAMQQQPAIEQKRLSLEVKTFREAYYGSGAASAAMFYTPSILVDNPEQAVWSPDERYLAAITVPKGGMPPNQLELHDMAGNALKMVYRMDSMLEQVAFSPDSRHLAVVTENGELSILNVSTEAVLTTVVTGGLYPLDVAWSANSRFVAVLDIHYNTHIYDLPRATTQTIATGITSSSPVSMAFSPTDDAQLYYFVDAAIFKHARTRPGPVRQVYATPADVSMEYMDYPSAAVGVWLDGGQRLLYKSQGYPLQLLQVQGDGLAFVRAIGEGAGVQAWNSSALPLLYEYLPIVRPSDSRYNGSDLQYARGWNVNSGDALSALSGVRKQIVDDMALTPDGSQLASLGYLLTPLEDGKYQTTDLQTVSIWQLDIQKEIFEWEVPGATSVAFSPKANYLSVYFSSGRVAVWPLNVSRIYTWLNAGDKDRYLQRLATKGNEPLQNRIEEWELERGINLKPEENLGYLTRRENPKVRQNWGLHFVSQAWLSVENRLARSRFNQALNLHEEPDKPGRIRATQQDTSAVVNIYFEQAYFEQVRGQNRDALAWIAKARQLTPQLNRIRMWEVLYAWQQGNQIPALQMLLSSTRTQLSEEIRQWKRRDVPLPQERFFNRILAVSQSQYDPVIQLMATPTFEADVSQLPADLRIAYLLDYYRLNREHPGLFDNAADRRRFMEMALRFLDENEAYMVRDENGLRLYIQCNYDLQMALQEEGKQQELEALRLRAENILEKLEAIAPDNQEYKAYALYAKVERLLAQLKINPNSVAEVEERLRSLAREYASVDIAYVTLLQGHCLWMRGDERGALDIYVALLASDQYDEGTILTLINTQLAALAPESAPRAEDFVRLWSDYQTARTSFEYLEQEALLTDYTQLAETYPSLWEAATTRYRIANELQQTYTLPADTLVSYRDTWASMGDIYTWSLLEAGKWEDALAVAQMVALDMPDLNWPKIPETLQRLFREGWSPAKSQIAALRNLPNDSHLSESYPLLGDVMLQLPSAITTMPAFQKYHKKWMAAAAKR